VGRSLRRGATFDPFDGVEDSVEVLSPEEHFGAFGCQVHERCFVEAAGRDDSGGGEFVDEQVHERDLVAAVALVVEEAGERYVGGRDLAARTNSMGTNPVQDTKSVRR